MEKERKFKVGDVVRVREWDDMAEEFGFLEVDDDVINCKNHFIEEMEDLCGKEFKITGISIFDNIEGLDTFYNISEDMLELVEKNGLGFSVEDLRPNQLAVFNNDGEEVNMIVGLCSDGELGFNSGRNGKHWWMGYHLNDMLRHADAELIAVYSPTSHPNNMFDFTTEGRELIWSRSEIKKEEAKNEDEKLEELVDIYKRFLDIIEKGEALKERLKKGE